MRILFIVTVALVLVPCSLFAFIGGQVAQSGQFPFIGLVEYNCTTSIIAPNKLLLAAHCVTKSRELNELNVGQELRLYTSPIAVGSNPVEIKIKKIDIHSSWQNKIDQGLFVDDFIHLNDTSDLAIITLTENINSHSRQPIQVIGFDFTPLKLKQPVYAGGYGCETRGEPNRDPKYKFAIKAIKSFRQNRVSLDTENISPIGKSLGCQGDSGGPVFILKDKKYYVVGVNSRVWGNTEKDGRLSFVNISKHKDWITKILLEK